MFLLSFRNTVYTYSPKNVKSLYSAFGSGSKNKFSADIELERTGYTTTTSITDFPFSGTRGYKFIGVMGFNGDASRNLVQGDIVQFSDVNGDVFKYVVQYATRPDGVKRSRIYLDAPKQADVVNASVVKGCRPLSRIQ